MEGIKVLDIGVMLAAPLAGGILADQGAEVIKVDPPGIGDVMRYIGATCKGVGAINQGVNRGKRSLALDLKTPEGRKIVQQLATEADVFSQGYRPGIMQNLGFGPEDLAAARPGIVYVSISCFGADGPFSHRAGWEQVAQTVTGIAHDGAREDRPDGPALLPAAANDYTTGYLAAYGVMLALAKRATEGGSYHVRVSLCRSGMLIYEQGKVDFDGWNNDLTAEELDAIRIESRPASGPLRHLGPVLRLSETPPRWTRPTPTLGGDAAEWPAFRAAAE